MKNEKHDIIKKLFYFNNESVTIHAKERINNKKEEKQIY